MSSQRCRVLIVDESPRIRDPGRLLLLDRAGQFDVVAAAPGESAVVVCQTHSIDCVVIDHTSYEKDGERLLARQPATWAAPTAVVLLDRPDEATVARLTAKGVGDWLAKSDVDPLRLRHAVRNAVERRKLQQQFAAGQELLRKTRHEFDEFVSIVSHDLSAPARRIDGFCQLLAKRYQDKLAAEANEFLGFLTDESKRLQRLLGELLAYSRLNTRQQPKQPIDASEVLRKVLADLDARIHQCNAHVTSDSLPTVIADRSQFFRLLHNLIDNSLKFRGDCVPALHIECQPREGHWQFCVQDNGPGIDPKQTDRVFRVFEQLQLEDECEGSGMGLATCKKIVELHGGQEIRLESEPGHGCRVYFTWRGGGEN